MHISLRRLMKICASIRGSFLLLFLAGSLCTLAQNKKAVLLYKDPSISVESRVKDLLARMTLQEKVAQMRHIHSEDYDANGALDINKLINNTNGLSFGCIEAFPYSSEQFLKTIYHVQKYMREQTRLGIPIIPVMEGLHGTVQDGCTIYPQSIAVASTFNPGLTYRMAENIAKEMKAIGVKQVLSPGLDLARELRWGRVEETYGEDPFLVSQMGVAYVKGLRSYNLICTPKHFIAHGTPQGGLNLASVEGGKRQLLSLYMQPFYRVIKEANPLSIMNAYSSYDGEPVTGSSYLMKSILRDSLKFQGYVYSDWGSVSMLSYFHKTAKDGADAAVQSTVAGIDLEAGGRDYISLVRSVEEKKIDIKYIDQAVSNILYVKFASGLFEDPLPDTSSLRKHIHTKQSISLSKEIADESAVLLKNNKILPFDVNKIKSLAIIGPNADQVQFGDYTWTRSNEDGITPLQGIKSLAGRKLAIHYAKGCDLVSQDKTGFKDALKAVKLSEACVVFVGSQSASLAREYKNSTSGEGFDLSDLKLPGVQEDLIKELKALGKPVVVVLVTGRPFAIPWIKENADAIIVQWYAGEQGGNSIADILFGRVNPSGKLAVSFPQSVGHLPSFYNYSPTDKGFYHKQGSLENPGRDYVFSSPQALWPFGFGLSYTDFNYSNISVSNEKVLVTDTINVILDINNSGSIAGKEVVQLYVRDLVSSVVTPIKQLKQFHKVSLKAGETKQITLQLAVNDLFLYDKNYSRVVELGEFELQIGTSSTEIKLKKTITVLSGKESELTKPQPSATKANENLSVRGEVIEVKGTVRDVQATVLPGVAVRVKGKSYSTITNSTGAYEIKANLNDTLQFYLKDYTEQEVIVTKDGNLSIKLVPKG